MRGFAVSLFLCTLCMGICAQALAYKEALNEGCTSDGAACVEDVGVVKPAPTLRVDVTDADHDVSSVSRINHDLPLVVELILDSGDSRALAKRVFGFNTNLLHGRLGFGDREFADKLRRLNPAVLRFPGGTLGNYYAWESGGFFEERMLNAPTQKLRNRYRRQLRELNRLQGGKIPFKEFAEICDTLNIEPLLVANLYSGDFDQVVSWAKYVKENRINVSGWELGNELYARRYHDRFDGPKAYVDQAERLTRALKAVDPGIRVGVPIAATVFGSGLATKVRSSMRKQAWNREIADKDFYDAVSVHLYTKLPDVEPDALRAVLFTSVDRSLPLELDHIRKTFPGKEVWISEWNYFGYKNKALNGSVLNAVFVADFFVEILKYPELVKLSAYHQLAAGGAWPSVFFKRKGRDRESVVEESILFPFFEEIGRLFSAAEVPMTIPLKIENAEEYRNEKGYSPLNAVAFVENGEIVVVAVNRTKRNLRLKLWDKGTESLVQLKPRCLFHTVPATSEQTLSQGTAKDGTVVLPETDVCFFEFSDR